MNSPQALLIGKGYTGHERHIAGANRFRYPIFFLKFRVDAEAALNTGLRRKFLGLFSFRAEDYLWKKSGGVDLNIRAFVKEKCGYEADEVWLITMPRMFGYAFNPVSFWFFRKNDELDAVLCEVNNTFGERHFYWVTPPEGKKLEGRWIKAEKKFHVSPFLPVEGNYQFFFRDMAESTRVDVNYFDSNGALVLSTWLEGRISPLEENSLSRLLFSYGWMTVLVVLRIHYQALKLWFKGAKFFRKPDLPKKEITP